MSEHALPNKVVLPNSAAPAVRPPTKHQLAVMIWLAVFPTLTVLNLALGDWLRTLPTVPRTFVLATVAVPVVMYGLMPQLHRLRVRLLAQCGRYPVVKRWVWTGRDFKRVR
jgi:antibiotic biosynthesis monooxygenase (ABM) superfamily enzyme